MSPQQTEAVVEVFSRPATVKVLCALLDAGEEVPAREVIERSGVSHQTFYDNVDVLEGHGLVERAGRVGNVTMYRAVFESPAVEAFETFREALDG